MRARDTFAIRTSLVLKTIYSLFLRWFFLRKVHFLFGEFRCDVFFPRMWFALFVYECVYKQQRTCMYLVVVCSLSLLLHLSRHYSILWCACAMSCTTNTQDTSFRYVRALSRYEIRPSLILPIDNVTDGKSNRNGIIYIGTESEFRNFECIKKKPWMQYSTRRRFISFLFLVYFRKQRNEVHCFVVPKSFHLSFDLPWMGNVLVSLWRGPHSMETLLVATGHISVSAATHDRHRQILKRFTFYHIPIYLQHTYRQYNAFIFSIFHHFIDYEVLARLKIKSYFILNRRTNGKNSFIRVYAISTKCSKHISTSYSLLFSRISAIDHILLYVYVCIYIYDIYHAIIYIEFNIHIFVAFS